MLLDTPLCGFGRSAPDFKLNSFDTDSYTQDDRVGAKAYGTVCTQDFFGLNSNLELQYLG